MFNLVPRVFRLFEQGGNAGKLPALPRCPKSLKTLGTRLGDVTLQFLRYQIQGGLDQSLPLRSCPFSRKPLVKGEKDSTYIHEKPYLDRARARNFLLLDVVSRETLTSVHFSLYRRLICI